MMIVFSQQLIGIGAVLAMAKRIQELEGLLNNQQQLI